MNLHVLALVPVVALLLAARLGSGALLAAEGGVPGFDPAKPDGWTASVDRAEGELRRTAKALAAVALDTKRPDEDRRKAVFALGKIGNQESLEFLVSHVALTIPMGVIKYDDDALKETPCYYVLLTQGPRWRDRNLNILGAILEALDTPRTETELLDYATVLRKLLTKDKVTTKERADMFVEYELKTEPPKARRKNLEAIRRILKTLE